MALIIQGKSKCSICGKVLNSFDKTLGWKAFLEREHKFWKYSDSAMHKECFKSWEHKEEFEHLHNYQPLINFENPEIKEQIRNFGMPDWLKEIKLYREK